MDTANPLRRFNTVNSATKANIHQYDIRPLLTSDDHGVFAARNVADDAAT